MTIESSLFRLTPYFMNFIFNGQMFSFWNRQSIASATTVNAIQAKTGAGGKIIHTFGRNHAAEAGGPFVVSLIEAPATITDGTPLTTIANLDRRSTKMPQLQYFSLPTNVTGGTVIDEIFIPTGSGPSATGVSGTEGIERILKPNTNYVIRVQNIGSQTATFQTNILTYESGN